MYPCVCAPYLLGCTSFTGAVSLLSRHLAVLSRARRLCRDWHLVLVCTEDDIEHAALPDAGDKDGPALRAYFTRVARVADAISVPTATLAAVDASGRSCVSPALVASAHACGLAVFARWLHDGVAHQAVVPPPPGPGSSSAVPVDGVASGEAVLPAETGQPPRGSPGSPKGISAGARALRDALPEYVLRCCTHGGLPSLWRCRSQVLWALALAWVCRYTALCSAGVDAVITLDPARAVAMRMVAPPRRRLPGFAPGTLARGPDSTIPSPTAPLTNAAAHPFALAPVSTFSHVMAGAADTAADSSLELGVVGSSFGSVVDQSDVHTRSQQPRSVSPMASLALGGSLAGSRLGNHSTVEGDESLVLASRVFITFPTNRPEWWRATPLRRALWMARRTALCSRGYRMSTSRSDVGTSVVDAAGVDATPSSLLGSPLAATPAAARRQRGHTSGAAGGAGRRSVWSTGFPDRASVTTGGLVTFQPFTQLVAFPGRARGSGHTPRGVPAGVVLAERGDTTVTADVSTRFVLSFDVAPASWHSGMAPRPVLRARTPAADATAALLQRHADLVAARGTPNTDHGTPQSDDHQVGPQRSMSAVPGGHAQPHRGRSRAQGPPRQLRATTMTPVPRAARATTTSPTALSARRRQAEPRVEPTPLPPPDAGERAASTDVAEDVEQGSTPDVPSQPTAHPRSRVPSHGDAATSDTGGTTPLPWGSRRDSTDRRLPHDSAAVADHGLSGSLYDDDDGGDDTAPPMHGEPTRPSAANATRTKSVRRQRRRRRKRSSRDRNSGGAEDGDMQWQVPPINWETSVQRSQHRAQVRSSRRVVSAYVRPAMCVAP